MTDGAATFNHPQQATRRSIVGRLPRVLLGIAAGATVMVAAPANADPGEGSGPSYQLGYNKAVEDGRYTVTRLRAMGFPDAATVISGQTHNVCARELASVREVDGVNDEDFLRGCASGVQSLVITGVAG
ncbi:hypothetical protein MB901379_04353 [Mycobacterium basiliense]|uniref:Uncharacterized protein n=1 Tax=Mycobacterium basiliense TaxID=2094119 RepID=A0A447GJV6_9MYCO|nr:hypothetical protein [Mycobacterium basiliense]VDM90744.1 hypothetical protein MB901379_04353 [Mycobacterium basiliense]